MHQLGVEYRHTGGAANRVVAEGDELVIEDRPSEDDLVHAWSTFRALDGLPSAPNPPVVYARERNRPQPALDANRDGGMTVTIGRLRPCPVLDYKFIALGHNTIRGAAGVAILNAELMHREGLL